MSWRRPEAAGERASGIAQSCRRRDAPRPAADGLDETEPLVGASERITTKAVERPWSDGRRSGIIHLHSSRNQIQIREAVTRTTDAVPAME